ncbi:MAG TPA: LysR family transcriptional regulator [Steroidobacteraceae bacterium]|nr:LysR family transcriptional regulator [Steroidobacteraceae bacterium]
MKQSFTVRRGALDGVEAFLSVARHRSFRKAAAEMGVTPSAIGQAVRKLETRLGATLFLRTTRSVGLTEAGERFLSRAKPAFEELVAASEVARGLGQRPSGLLRLSVPRAVVPVLLEPLIASFCQAYPEVEVEISINEKLVDLASQGFDAGIRMGQFIAADMVAVRLTPAFRLIIVGSPAYLDRSGRPERPEDLRAHACLRLRRTNGAIAPWSLNDSGRDVEIAVSGPLIANDVPTMLGAAVSGVGLAQVPAPVAAGAVRAGKLEEVLLPFAPTAPGVFLYYPSRRQMMPKLRVFVDHVKRRSDTNKVSARGKETGAAPPPAAIRRSRSRSRSRRRSGSG